MEHVIEPVPALLEAVSVTVNEFPMVAALDMLVVMVKLNVSVCCALAHATNTNSAINANVFFMLSP